MNDEAVLAAARALIAAHGPGASMADIARRAGVGVGSLYRRYPNKDALVQALQVRAVRDAARLAEEVADAAEKAGVESTEDDGAVGAFLRKQITDAAGPLLRPPGVIGPIPDDLAAVSDELRVGIERLIARDRAMGLLPDGFTAADVMQLLLHLRPPMPLRREGADALHLRYLRLVLRGLRDQAETGDALPEGRRWDEWVSAWYRPDEVDPAAM